MKRGARRAAEGGWPRTGYLTKNRPRSVRPLWAHGLSTV